MCSPSSPADHTRSVGKSIGKFPDEMSEGTSPGNSSPTVGKAVATTSEGTLPGNSSPTEGETVITPTGGTSAENSSPTEGETVTTSTEGIETEARISTANLTKLVTNGTNLAIVGEKVSPTEKTGLDNVEKTRLHSADEENSNLTRSSPPRQEQEPEGLVIIYDKPIVDEKC